MHYAQCNGTIFFCVQEALWNVLSFNNGKIVKTLHWVDKVLVLQLCYKELHCFVIKSIIHFLCKHLKLGYQHIHNNPVVMESMDSCNTYRASPALRGSEKDCEEHVYT